MGALLETFATCGSGNKSDDESYHEASKGNESQQSKQTSQKRDVDKRLTSSTRLREGSNDLFGYHFNIDGVLCDEAGYRFGQQEAKTIDKDNFPKLATKIMEMVQGNLVNVYGLEKITIPVDASDNEPKSFIFATKNALSTNGKLLILIHGSGTVVAGVWSKKVIMYDNLYKGSQLQYVEKAIADGYEVVVLNTNVNSQSAEVDSWKGRVPIRGSGDPEEHALYVWDNFILKSKAQHIAIVAHSYGGVVTTQLARRRTDSFLARVFAVAFTDSVHRLDHKETRQKVVKFFCDNARNWVTSDKVLDTPVGKNRKEPLSDAPKVSAGDLRHEWTSYAALGSVFTFFKGRLSEAQKRTGVADPKAGTDF